MTIGPNWPLTSHYIRTNINVSFIYIYVSQTYPSRTTVWYVVTLIDNIWHQFHLIGVIVSAQHVGYVVLNWTTFLYTWHQSSVNMINKNIKSNNKPDINSLKCLKKFKFLKKLISFKKVMTLWINLWKNREMDRA